MPEFSIEHPGRGRQMAEDGATESARWEKPLEASPGKATQSHPKATTKPYTRHRLRRTEPPQGHPKAPPRPPQGCTKATPRLHQTHPTATPKPHQSHTKATLRSAGVLAGLSDPRFRGQCTRFRRSRTLSRRGRQRSGTLSLAPLLRLIPP